MAIKKCRLIRQAEDGAQNTIHLETSSTIVQRPDGSTVERALTTLAGMPHLPSGGTASQVLAKKSATNYDAGWTDPVAVKLATARKVQVNLASGTGDTFDGSRDILPGVSGVLPVGHGGTGVSDLAALKDKLGVTTPGVSSTPAAYPGTIPAVNETLDWCGETWRVVYRGTTYAVLAMDILSANLSTLLSKTYACQCNTHTDFAGSNLHWECLKYADKIGLIGADYIMPIYGSPVFPPSYDMVHHFPYYTQHQWNRIWRDEERTAVPWYLSTITPEGGHEAPSTTYAGSYYISAEGNFTKAGCGEQVAYIRPHVAIRL